MMRTTRQMQSVRERYGQREERTELMDGTSEISSTQDRYGVAGEGEGEGLERMEARHVGRSEADSTMVRVGVGASCARYPCATRITAPLRSEYKMTCCGRR